MDRKIYELEKEGEKNGAGKETGLIVVSKLKLVMG